MNNRLAAVLVVVVGLLFLASLSTFTVDQRQRAIVFQLGEIKDVASEPGLHFKWPLIQNVRYFDNRILTLDTQETEPFMTSEKKNVLVDSFVKWRIEDLKLFYVAASGDEAQAQNRLNGWVKSALFEEFGKRRVHDVISGERDKIMEIVRERVAEDAKRLGIRIVDVRIKRVELPDEVRESVYRRMEAERKSAASQSRSQGFSEAERVRAEADRDREIIIAEAYKSAQRVKGEGDARASAIYARAYSENPEFYAFYRSLDAYRNTFKGKNDVLVIDPSSEFFRYFKNPARGGKP
jgi:modulator of FtsH protease HflC